MCVWLFCVWVFFCVRHFFIFTFVILLELDSLTMYMVEEKLIGGKEYSFQLEAWNPNSNVTTLSYNFLINIPPFGGKCTIQPDSGKYQKELLVVVY